MKKKTIKTAVARLEILPFFVVFFIAGLKFSQLFTTDLAILYFFLTTGALAASLIFKGNQKFCQTFILLAVVCSGLFYGNLRIFPAVESGELRLFDKSSGQLSGVFSGEYKQYRSGSISLMLKNARFTTASQTIAIPGSIFCRCRNTNLIPEPEQLYRLHGTFNFKPNQRYPGFSATATEHISNRSMLHELGGKIQRRLRDGLNMVLTTRHAAVTTGFLLGDTSQLSKEDRQLFRETGISHLLAVSGQHLMVLSLVLAAMLHLMHVPPISRSIMISVFLVLYAFATSGSPSIVRALIMYISTAFVFHFESAPSAVRPLSLAAFIILLFDPAQIIEPSFILSFSAVAGIILLRPMFEYYLKRLRLPKTLARYFSVTFAANLAVMPMAAMFFGAFSLAALLVNPAIVWMFSIILPAGFVVGVISAFSPGTGLFLAPGLSLPLDGLLSFLEWARMMPGAYVYLGAVPGFVVALVYAGLLAWSGRWNRQMLAGSTAPAMPKPAARDAKPEETNSAIRQPDVAETSETTRYTAEPRHAVFAPGREQHNLFKDAALIKTVDAMLLSCRRRSLKNTVTACEVDFDPQLLGLDNQNLFYQLLDLDRKVLGEESFRLIQAQVFLLALAGSEILNRISLYLQPPPDPGDFSLDFVVKDRFLAMAVLGDRLLSSSLLTRAGNQQFMLLTARGQSLFARGRSQLQRLLQRNDSEMLQQHFALRRDLLTWLHEFLEFDGERRRKSATE